MLVVPNVFSGVSWPFAFSPKLLQSSNQLTGNPILSAYRFIPLFVSTCSTYMRGQTLLGFFGPTR